MTAVAVLWWNLAPTWHETAPDSAHPIGTRTYDWVDIARPELFTADLKDHRELVAQVWYPAAAGSDGARSPYVSRPQAAVLASLFGFPPWVLTGLVDASTAALVDVPIADGRFPIAVLLTGRAGWRASNTVQAEALVVSGYVVVGIEMPYATAATTYTDGRIATYDAHGPVAALLQQSVEPDTPAPTLNGLSLPNGITPYLAADVSSTVDELQRLDQSGPLAGHLDTSRIGVMGVSMGGAVGAQACHDDARIRACLVIEAPIPLAPAVDGIRQPLLVLTRTADQMRAERARIGGWTEADIVQHQTTMRDLVVRSAGPAVLADVDGFFHTNFTDAPLWSPILSWLGIAGPIAPSRGAEILTGITTSFFDATLRNHPNDWGLGAFSEVTVVTRR